jgi:hypothetical protein
LFPCSCVVVRSIRRPIIGFVFVCVRRIASVSPSAKGDRCLVASSAFVRSHFIHFNLEPSTLDIAVRLTSSNTSGQQATSGTHRSDRDRRPRVCVRTAAHVIPCRARFSLCSFSSPPTTLLRCVRLSPFTLVRVVSRSVTRAGSCTAWSMVSSRMARCRLIRPSAAVMMRSTPSSPRLVPASMSVHTTRSVR